MRILSIALPALALLVPEVARAERPTTTYQWVDPGMATVLEPAALSYNTIYLNGCFGDGCNLSRGYNDSRTNTSSIAQGHLSQFTYGPMVWDAVVDCVKKNYEPFDVVITDEDPGNVPHFEAMVAGHPDELGMGGAGGVSPFACGIIDNAITFSFANIYGGSVDDICWTVSQETAHAFGLEHESLCGDPMTYRQDCSSRKWFNNVNAPCGEFSPRSCDCGGTTQNSFRMITDVFGPGTVETPTLVLDTPKDDTEVDAGFAIRADVTGAVPIQKVEVLINGKMIADASAPPWAFNAPADLSDGRQIVEVRAYNVYGGVDKKRVTVTQGEPCGGSDDCRDGEACVDGRCVVGPGQPGGLGEVCGGNEQCASGLCGNSSDGMFCGEQCEVGGGGCPDGFGCLDTGEFGVCWKGYDDGGCQIAGRGAFGPIGIGFALALLMLTRRRRSV